MGNATSHSAESMAHGIHKRKGSKGPAVFAFAIRIQACHISFEPRLNALRCPSEFNWVNRKGAKGGYLLVCSDP